MGKGMRAGKKNRVRQGGGAGGQKAQMKRIQELQDMQVKMAEMTAELEAKEITTSSGGGVVNVTVSGKKEIVSLEIDKDVVDPDDVETLQDLIIAAVNEGMRQVDQLVNSEYDKVTGGLNIPGM